MHRNWESGRACLLALAEPKSICCIGCCSHSCVVSPATTTSRLPVLGCTGTLPKCFHASLSSSSIAVILTKNTTVLSVWKYTSIGKICKKSDPCRKWIYGIKMTARGGQLWIQQTALQGLPGAVHRLSRPLVGKEVSWWVPVASSIVSADQFNSHNYHFCVVQGVKDDLLMEVHKESNCRRHKNTSEWSSLSTIMEYFLLVEISLFCQVNLGSDWEFLHVM